ncbi:MAG: response regulator [Alphaproteobacteria bacterium]
MVPEKTEGAVVTRILVVDDSAIARLYLVSILEDLGFLNIEEAGDGDEGIARFNKSPPDVMFLDIEMPVMNGIEVLKRIAETKGKTRIVMMSAMEYSSVIDDCLLAGAEDYIRKDLPESAVARRISDLLG